MITWKYMAHIILLSNFHTGIGTTKAGALMCACNSSSHSDNQLSEPCS